jgi:hypothetical protein
MEEEVIDDTVLFDVEDEGETADGEATTATDEAELTELEQAKAEALKYKAIAQRQAKKLAKQSEAGTSQAQSNKPNPAENYPSPDELILIAQGYEPEVLAEAKAIAKGKGIALKEAVKDPLFVAFKTQQDKEKKREEAQMRASSGAPNKSETLIKPGMTREEHKAAWEKMMAK